MGIEECSWSGIDVLNIVASAELVTIVRDVYLCVWYGGGTVEIYDVTDSTGKSEMQSLRFRAPRTLRSAYEAIDKFFIVLDEENIDLCLTAPLLGAIVEVQSDSTTEENN